MTKDISKIIGYEHIKDVFTPIGVKDRSNSSFMLLLVLLFNNTVVLAFILVVLSASFDFEWLHSDRYAILTIFALFGASTIEILTIHRFRNFRVVEKNGKFFPQYSTPFIFFNLPNAHDEIWNNFYFSREQMDQLNKSDWQKWLQDIKDNKAIFMKAAKQDKINQDQSDRVSTIYAQ